jgi:predicted nuclease of predicted toxin-antitoxin system
LKPRSNSKKPHDPFEFVLDEGLSGDRLHKLLTNAKFVVFHYEKLALGKNKRVPDETVLEAAYTRGYVLISKDKAMDHDEIEAIIKNRGRVVILTDKTGGVLEFAAALIAAKAKLDRSLLDSLHEPVVIRLNHDASVQRVRGADELRERYRKFLSGRIARIKRIELKHAKIGQPARTVGLEG